MAEAGAGSPHGGDAAPPGPPEEQELSRRLRRLYPAVNQDETPLPRSWSPKDKYNYIGLSQGNLRVHYKGARLGWRRRVRPRPRAGRPRRGPRLGRSAGPAGRGLSRQRVRRPWGRGAVTSLGTGGAELRSWGACLARGPGWAARAGMPGLGNGGAGEPGALPGSVCGLI